MADVNVLAAACSSLSRQQKVIYRHFRLNFIGVSSSLRCNKKQRPLLKISTVWTEKIC